MRSTVASNKQKSRRGAAEGGCKTAVALQVSALAEQNANSTRPGKRPRPPSSTPPSPVHLHIPPTTQRGVMRFRQSYLPRLLYLIPQCLDSGGHPSLSFGCATTRGAGKGGVGCTAAADKYAKERNTIFVKRTTDNLPLNRAWHFKQAKPTTTTGRNEEDEEWVLGGWQNNTSKRNNKNK